MQHQSGQDRSPTPENQIVNPATITCPQCGSAEDLKNIIRNGIQKCYCKICLYYFSHG
jgi:transposase-like protein